MKEQFAYYDLNPLRDSVMNDEDFFVLMLYTFINNTTTSLALLQQHVDAKDWKGVGEVAHKMLSSYKHLQIIHLIPYLEKLEQLIKQTMKIEEIVEANKLVQHFSVIILQQLNEMLVNKS